MPAEPIEIQFTTTDGPKHFVACGTCGAIYTHDHHRASASAARCCDPRCDDCGERPEKHHAYCRACAAKHGAAREAAAFAAAKKVTPEEYGDGWVYFDGRGSQDGYFHGVDDVIDWCDENGVELPAYVWGCTEMPLSISADSVIESAFEEHYEGAADGADEKGLQKLLDAWCEAQGVVSWHEDRSVAVVIDAEAVPRGE